MNSDCHRTVAYRPGTPSKILTEHYRRIGRDVRSSPERVNTLRPSQEPSPRSAVASPTRTAVPQDERIGSAMPVIARSRQVSVARFAWCHNGLTGT